MELVAATIEDDTIDSLFLSSLGAKHTYTLGHLSGGYFLVAQRLI